MEEIRRGARGRAVADVQTRLAALGYSVGASGADGVFAEATERAVAAFRADRGLEPAGHVDGPTWRALVDASLSFGDRTIYFRRPHLHGEDVRQLQQALATLGFRCGVDGVFGVNTERAVRDFQRNVGLPADGIVGRATTAALANLAPALAARAPAPPAPRTGAVFGAGLAGRRVSVRTHSPGDGGLMVARECASRLASLLELAGVEVQGPASDIAAEPPSHHFDILFLPSDDGLRLTIGIRGSGDEEMVTELIASLPPRLGRALADTPPGAPDHSVTVSFDGVSASEFETFCQRLAVAVFDALASASASRADRGATA
jgi:peptidoglycan hydrolase-like protein with peptidoglycan-binding domain